MKEKIIEIFQDENIDEKSLGFIVNALNRVSKTKMNYIKFKVSQESILKINNDENIAIQSTYAALESLGFTKERLITSIDEYKKVLSNEKNAFDNALQKQLNTRVLSKQNNITKLRDAINKHNLEIENLKKKVEAYNQQIINADKDAIEAEKKIEAQGVNFNKTYNNVLEKIDKDLLNYRNLL